MRRLAVHALSSFVVGLVCTLGTAPFADDPAVAKAFFLCTPALCALVGALASLPARRGQAVVAAGVGAVVAGMCNATAVYLVSELLSGRSPGTELGLVVLFSIPYGGVPGVVYAAPMGAAVLAARAADGRDDSSALRPLAAVLGVVGILALVVARTASTRYALWPVVVGTGTAVAFVCLAQAAVDLVAALEVHNAARGRAPDLAVVAPFGSVWYLCRIAAEGEGPYRTADVTHPIRRLDRAPARWIRARILGATGLAALAVAVGVLVG